MSTQEQKNYTQRVSTSYIVYVEFFVVYMSQRINIAVPGDLHSRLEAVKENLNVSGICQEAIESAVSLEEIKVSAMSKREAAIARLKIEAEQEHNYWYQEGKKQGLEDATDLSYEEISRVAEWGNTGKEKAEICYEEPFEWLADVLESVECPEPEKEHFITGWFGGVIEFWDSVKAEVA